MTLRRLELTDDLLARLADVEYAQHMYRPGRESAAVVELPKLALADAVLAAVHAQIAAHTLQLAALPKRQPIGMRRPKRRRRA